MTIIMTMVMVTSLALAFMLALLGAWVMVCREDFECIPPKHRLVFVSGFYATALAFVLLAAEAATVMGS